MIDRRAQVGWCCWGLCRAERRGLAGRLDAIGWGAFFVWVGVALLADVGWGPALLGIGLIILGGQIARWLYRLRLEGFWLLVGAGFLLGGLWRVVDATLSLLPVLLVLAGLALVVGALLSGRLSDKA
ncbi:MAG: hypothetical protein GY769_10870 [bacterium]|nr:hypothetical protein [bacterium]